MRTYAELPSPLLLRRCHGACDANAMEKSKYDPQAIHEHRDDYVGRTGQHSTIMMSAEPGAVGIRSGGCCDGRTGEDGRHSDVVSSRGRSSTSRNRNRAADDEYAPCTTRRRRRTRSFTAMAYLLTVVFAAGLWISPASAVFIPFDNCLSDSVQHDEPIQLQFIPMFMDAVFDTEDPSHKLQVRVWGNVTGSGPTTKVLLPPPEDPYWRGNESNRGGKIINIPDPELDMPKLTTLFSKVNVLTYEPWSNSVDFCGHLENGACPLGPNWTADPENPDELTSFGFSNNFYSTYAMTSFSATLMIKYGDPDATPVGCVSGTITPDIGDELTRVTTFVPMVILVVVGIATAFAAIYSPWGSTDTLRWTTNYGRDEDLLRLVTPGFGDCLQYIQFVALTGGLTLNYPGFYQPIVSKAAWSTLMFNQSFVSQGNGSISLVDGIYVTHGSYGLDRLRQYVGMSEVDDVWAGMAVWLLVILGVVLIAIQAGFLARWVYRHINNTQEEDLRAKNFPFSMGNVIRIVFNYFLLPIVALSMFQLVEAGGNSPNFVVGLAALMLVLIIGFAIWLLYFIVSTKPRSYLFDDLPTVLLYGSLYNTYADNTASFALIPVLLTIVRGITIGVVQPSGTAQLVLLAICEIIFILTLHAFRPFHSPTSMNAFHTFFSGIRLATVLLMVAFTPSLGVTDGPKGWIGYTILMMHAIVLILGFLLNAIQTIVEVAARMLGAGGDDAGATRGGLAKVFGMRQLSRRLPRRDGASRQSQLSNAAMLDAENDRKAYMMDSGRLRSQSAGSTGVLLNRQSTGMESSGVDPFGAIPPHQLPSGSYTPTTPGEASTFSFLPSAAAPSGHTRNRNSDGLGSSDQPEPWYYRPPRMRRPTVDAYSPAARSRASWASGDWPNKAGSQRDSGGADLADEGPSISGRNTPITQPPLDGSPEPKRSKADYSTREVDFYYGVRGPALNANVPSRRIKTGPADPTGPAASAAGWFKSLFGGKTKEQGKGFEVVRSARMPPGMKRPGEESPPEGVPVATGGVRNGPIDSDDESVRPRATNGDRSQRAVQFAAEGDSLVSPLGSDDEDSHDEHDDDFVVSRISDIPPMLPGIELAEGGIELPSRFPSKATSRGSTRRQKSSGAELVSRVPSNKPSVPRKSSRRQSQSVDLSLPSDHLMPEAQPQTSAESTNLPFDRSNSNARQSTISSNSNSTMITPESGPDGHTRTHSSALGRFSADIRGDRPTSVGYVHQHNIRTINQTENPDFLGTTAEVVDGRNSGASSMEGSRS